MSYWNLILVLQIVSFCFYFLLWYFLSVVYVHFLSHYHWNLPGCMLLLQHKKTLIYQSNYSNQFFLYHEVLSWRFEDNEVVATSSCIMKLYHGAFCIMELCIWWKHSCEIFCQWQSLSHFCSLIFICCRPTLNDFINYC